MPWQRHSPATPEPTASNSQIKLILSSVRASECPWGWRAGGRLAGAPRITLLCSGCLGGLASGNSGHWGIKSCHPGVTPWELCTEEPLRISL